MTNWSNKKLQIFRYLSYWAYVFCTIGIPMSLIAWQFDLLRKPGPTQLTGYGVLAIIVLMLLCGKHIKRAIAEMEICITKTVLQNMTSIIPFASVWIVLTFLARFISQVRLIALMSTVGLIFASFLDVWHTLILKELKKREK